MIYDHLNSLKYYPNDAENNMVVYDKIYVYIYIDMKIIMLTWRQRINYPNDAEDSMVEQFQ